jgi:hypothetical protein
MAGTSGWVPSRYGSAQRFVIQPQAALALAVLHIVMSNVDAATRARLDALIEEGSDLFDRFDREVRDKRFHPFVAASYDTVCDALIELRATLPERERRSRFLEWGSATGVVAIMADMLGFEACGIEIDDRLVDTARDLAKRHQSGARFAAGSFIPAGYRWKPKAGDGRMGTIGVGRLAYPELGYGLDDFDVVYGYPWDGEQPMMEDIMRLHGGPHALLLLMDPVAGLHVSKQRSPNR